MAVYYLAELSILSYSPAGVWPAPIAKFRRFGNGPFDRAHLSSTNPEATMQPLGPRASTDGMHTLVRTFRAVENDVSRNDEYFASAHFFLSLSLS